MRSRKPAYVIALAPVLVGIVLGMAATAQAPLPVTETLTISLPGGDAEAGREAFLALKCSMCHAVPAAPEMPTPTAELAGPPIGPALTGRTPNDLATSIVAPSHIVGLDVSEAVKASVEFRLLSPMGDFSEAMTVRQLVDILAFIRASGAGS